MQDEVTRSNFSAEMIESAEWARNSSTNGGLLRPEPGHSQPTPPYKTAAQIFAEFLPNFTEFQ